MPDVRKVELWAILELMGHQVIAGWVTEETIAGAAFVRVDVPETGAFPAYTRYFNPSSVYALNPTTEEVAKAAAANWRCKPASLLEFKPEPAAALPGGSDDEPPRYTDGSVL